MKKYYLGFLIFLLLIVRAKAEEHAVWTSDSVRLYVQVKGKGIPCVYIHGGPGSGSYWLEKFFGDSLEHHFQMIYIDQRGVGRSTSPVNHDYSLVRMIEDFEEVRRALDISEWITLGHSFGGILQMGYIASYPQSIRGMMMINCTLNMRESFCNSWIPKASELLDVQDATDCPDNPEDLLGKMIGLIGKLQEHELMWKMGFAYAANEQLMNETYQEIEDWNSDFSAVAFSILDYWQDYRHATSHIQVPVLFFYGQTDWMVGPTHFKDIAFPNMLLWGSDVGHMPFLEYPSDLERAIQEYRRKYGL